MPRCKAGRGSMLGMTVKDWPEADRRLWQAACAGGGIDAEADTAEMAQNTRDNYETAWARFLVWIRDTHPDAFDQPPAQRVRKDWVLAYLEDLRQSLKDRTVWCYACALRAMFGMLAPDANYSWLFPIIDNLERRAARQPRKHHPFVEVSRLYDYGVALMDAALASTGQPQDEIAEQYRDGLLFAFLATRPLRRDNLCQLRVGEGFSEQGGVYHVSIEPEAYKTTQPFEFVLPATLTPYIDLYLQAYRPTLAAGRWRRGTNHLFLSINGVPLTGDQLRKMTLRRSEEAFGVKLTPHDFRHCAATGIVKNNPEQWAIIKPVLGHRCLRTAEKHYINDQGVAAGNAFQALLQARKEAARAAERQDRTR